MELKEQLALANANSERMQNYLDNLLLRRNFLCTAKVCDESRLIVAGNVRRKEVTDQAQSRDDSSIALRSRIGFSMYHRRACVRSERALAVWQELLAFANSPVKLQSTDVASAARPSSGPQHVLDEMSKDARMHVYKQAATEGGANSRNEVVMTSDSQMRNDGEGADGVNHMPINYSPKSASSGLGVEKVEVCAHTGNEQTNVKRSEPKFEADRFDDDICELFASLRR